MRKFTFLLLLLPLLALSACSAEQTSAPTTAAPTTAAPTTAAPTTAAPTEPAQSTTLYVNLSAGDPAASSDSYLQFPLGYSGELTAQTLAEGLSQLSGQQFALARVNIDGTLATVDWAPEAALFSQSLDMTGEPFVFADTSERAWFMLDSLNDTLRANLGFTEVYFTMGGGQPLSLPDLMDGMALSSADLPYMNSTFYTAHDDVVGEETGTEDFSATQGLWRLDGDEATAFFVMDGSGSYETYYASGAKESAGYLTAAEPGAFTMFDHSGEQINTIYMLDETSFRLGQSGPTFILD